MHLILTLSICYEFRTKLRNVEGIITYSLGEDYCPYDFWEDSAEDTEETNSSDKTENCTEEIEYEDPAPDFGAIEPWPERSHHPIWRPDQFAIGDLDGQRFGSIEIRDNDCNTFLPFGFRQGRPAHDLRRP